VPTYSKRCHPPPGGGKAKLETQNSPEDVKKPFHRFFAVFCAFLRQHVFGVGTPSRSAFLLRPPTSDLGPRTSDLRLRTSDFGPQTSDLRPQTSDLRPRTLDPGPPPSSLLHWPPVVPSRAKSQRGVPPSSAVRPPASDLRLPLRPPSAFRAQTFRHFMAIFPLLSRVRGLSFTLPERRVCGRSFRLRKDVNE
jgi:hypothetical protein